MKLYFFALLLFLFFFPNAASGTGNRESGSQSAKEVLPGVPVQKDQFSMLEQYEAGHWFAKPSDNMLTVIGVSNHLIRRQDEIAAAKEDAARKAAMYFGIQGRIESVNSTGANYFDYLNDSIVEIIYDTDFEKYKNQLAFDPQNDVLVTREGIFVRFQCAVAAAGVNYNPTIINGPPKWLRNHGKPEFEGYLTAVGFSRNQRRLKDTIIKSAEDAAVRMIEGLSTAVNTKEVSVTGQGSISFIRAVSEGSLCGFQVIEFWIDPENGYVYSLAIARPAGQ